MIASDDSKVLSYDDIVVFKSDVHSLTENAWLTDNIINFAANYMKNELLDNDIQNKVCIVYSSCCELIKYSDSESIHELLTSFGVEPTKWNIFMFNDNVNPNLVYGGTHWSLILFHPHEGRFYLFDSSNQLIPSQIKKFVNKLYQCCNPKNNNISLYDCPKMDISGDCGVFTIEYLKAILTHINSGNISANFKFPIMDNGFIMNQRKHWRNTIYSLAKL